MNNHYLRRIYLQLATVVTVVVLLALGTNAVYSQHAFEQALVPQMARKMVSVGASINAPLVKGVQNDIAFDALYGVEQRFDAVKKELPEVLFVALTDTAGRLLHQRMDPSPEALAYMRSPDTLTRLAKRDAVAPAVRLGPQYVVSLPVFNGAQALGLLHIGVDVRFVDDIVLDMLYDVLIVLAVSLFFTLELLHFMAGAKLDASLRSLGDVFERGAEGNVRTQPRSRVGMSFGALQRAMDGMLACVNAQYAELVQAVDQGRRGPAHERLPGLASAQVGLLALAQRWRFGIEPPAGPGDEVQLAKIRTPLFVFILAEELTRSFLPSFAQTLSTPISWLSPQAVVGMPIALFMLVVALSQPFIGAYCERAGHRRTMMIGAGIASLGFLGSAMAGSVLDLLLWRGLCGLGYAMVFVASQAFVLDNATPATRARSFGLFVGAIMAASVCGPSIGGILADILGVRLTFAMAAALVAGSIAVIRLLPDERPKLGRAVSRLPKLSEIGGLMLNLRFMTVTGLAAMPAKMLLTGLCFYLVPLYVLSIGSTQAVAGRVLMVYAVAMVLLSPLAAVLATDKARMQGLVAGGLVCSGLGGVLMLAGPGKGWVFVAVTLVGLGQARSISAQSALGPLVAASLLTWLDFRHSFAVMSAAVLLSGLVFLVATRPAQQPAYAPA